MLKVIYWRAFWEIARNEIYKIIYRVYKKGIQEMTI